MKKQEAMGQLLGIMDRLRGEDGCPWDKAQTHESLKQYMLEEAYEVADAIDEKNPENLCEELGDVLLQVVFHAKVAEEAGNFNFADVADGISKKMLHRHPHIFGDLPKDELPDWEALKKEEKNQQTQTEVLRAIPKALPALVRGTKVLSKSHSEARKSVENLQETLDGFSAKVRQNSLTDKDFGLFLMEVLNISRFFQLNAELSLTNAIETFINEFETIEKASVEARHP